MAFIVRCDPCRGDDRDWERGFFWVAVNAWWFRMVKFAVPLARGGKLILKCVP